MHVFAMINLRLILFAISIFRRLLSNKIIDCAALLEIKLVPSVL